MLDGPGAGPGAGGRAGGLDGPTGRGAAAVAAGSAGVVGAASVAVPGSAAAGTAAVGGASVEAVGPATRPSVPQAAPLGVQEDELDPDGSGRPTARAEARDLRRLRMVAILLAILVLLGALPLYFGIRAATRDPVLNTLDGLDVPGWAAVKTEDAVSGSRWCLIDCRLRERTVESDGSPDETAKAYESALEAAGWRRWTPAQLCPEQPVDGHYTCWQRDELTLDLWVRQPSCAAEAAAATAAPVTPPATPAGCDGSTVSIKVRNAIDDDRTGPRPSTDPSLTGVDPDPIFTDDPLQDPTPSPS